MLTVIVFLEFNLPRGLGNIADRWSRSLKGGVGILAMGFVFTLTSFTCTVGFFGFLLLGVSKGDFLWPLIGMLSFSNRHLINWPLLLN